MKIKKIINWLVVLLVAGGAIFLVIKNKEHKSDYTLTPVTVGVLTKTVSADGTYLSKETADVSFRISGLLMETKADVGDTVKKGQVLAKLDAGVLTDSLKSAQGNLATQKQLLVEMKNHDDLYSGAQRNAQRGAVQSAQGAVDEILRQTQYTTMEAPMDGIIAKKNFNVGEFTQLGATVFLIIRDDEMRIEAKIPEVDIANIQIGQKVNIKFDAYPNDKIFAGVISSVDPSAIKVENVSYYTVKIAVDNSDANLKYGMNCTMYDETERKENVLSIPKWAVEKDGDARFITVSKDLKQNIIEKRQIETGLEGDGGMIEVVSGLSAIDEIATQIN